MHNDTAKFVTVEVWF